ncbi:MAG: OsmC family protein [Candidatus Heimdallarchaeota archaeon]
MTHQLWEVSVSLENFSIIRFETLGGWGIPPGPHLYCLYGLASCYAFTFAALAAMGNIELKRLEIAAETNIDHICIELMRTVANPIVEEAKWTVTVDSDADDEKIEKLKKLAEERCQAVNCLTNPIKLTIDVNHKGI